MSNIQGLLDKYANIEGERFFKELFANNEYQPARDVKDAVVVDVGALAGEFCAYVYDNARVIYAIEPFNSHYQELVENIKEFDLEKVKPFNLALSGQNGQGYFSTEAARGGNCLDSSGQEVETKTLAQFLKDQDIPYVDVLKIDIENSEQVVFAAPDFHEVAERIDLIIGEHLEYSTAVLEGLGFKKEVLPNNANLIFRRAND